MPRKSTSSPILRLFNWDNLGLYSCILALVVLGSKLYFLTLAFLHVPDALRYSDFFVFYAAAQILETENATSLLDPTLLNAQLGALFNFEALRAAGLNVEQYWLYPPTIFPWIKPLGPLPAHLALMLYYVLSLTLWFYVVRRYFRAQSTLSILPVLFAPIVFVNFSFEQNGIFSACILIAFISILRLNGSAIWLGVLATCLLFKPTLGLLIPVVLILERRWDGLVWSSILGGAYVAFVTWVWGIEYWIALFETHRDFQPLVEAGLYAQYAISAYGFFQQLGLGHIVSLWLHAAAAVAMLFCFIGIWHSQDWNLRCAAFLLISPLLSSYGNIYDFVPAAFAIGLLYPVFSKWKWGPVALGLFWFAPIAFRPEVNILGALEMPILNFALIGFLTWIALTQNYASSSESQ